MSENRPLLSVEHLTVEIASEEGILCPVDDASFTLSEGEALALVGESGCGKSLTAMALMRLLPGAARVREGRVELGGTELLRLPEAEMARIRGAGISIIFQEPATSFNPVMTIGAQIVEMIRAHRRVSLKEAKAQALRWLDRVGIPEAPRRFGAYPHELSGGLKQRAMIAMALSAEPKVVIADEPTTALDAATQAQILALLKELQREGRLALLLITHDLALLPGAVDRVALMYAGRIIEEASVKDFFERPAHPYAKALLAAAPKTKALDASASSLNRPRRLFAIEGSVPRLSEMPSGCAFAPRCPYADKRCAAEKPVLKRLAESGPQFGAGHSAACRFALSLKAAEPSAASLRRADDPSSNQGRAAAPPNDGAPVLAVSHLSVSLPPRGMAGWAEWIAKLKREAPKPLVTDVSFELKRGETLALVGESGSGKTTTAMAVLGLLPAHLAVEGVVSLEGEPHPAEGRGTARPLGFRQAVQVIFQDPFSSLDPRMSVRAVLDEALSALCPLMTPEEKRMRSEKLVLDAGLTVDALERFPHEFSGGQRQRIAIARALAAEPRILICDEPTSALDVSVQAQILNLLKRLQEERGLAYLLITHNFGVVEFAAHRIAVMRRGRIIEMDDAARVLREPRDDYTKMLLASVPKIAVR